MKFDYIKKYKKLLGRIVQFSYAEKTMLFVENSPAKDMFVIRNGLIKLEDTLSDGSARIVRLLTKSDIVGLEAFLNNHQRYDQTAIALQKTNVCRIPHQVFKDIISTDPNFYKAVLNEWHS
jgi:CRP-like cAMP-binding protein